MTMCNVKIRTARVYDDPVGTREDGYRVFVDRLWPRGESKDTFHYDLWAKDVAPSAGLREWFHDDPDGRWEEFRNRYIGELRLSGAGHELADDLLRYPAVTVLVTSCITMPWCLPNISPVRWIHRHELF